MFSQCSQFVRKTIPVLTICIAGSWSLGGFAQDKLKLQEIIVTAEKREQSLQDVPISISAFDKSKLDKFGIDEIEDIGTNVPNLYLNSFNNDSTTVRLFIRGIGQNDIQTTQDPSVALYIDGVYVGTSLGSGIESVDLERIEILRGPQGTLYGRNATGGAINLISARPEIGEFSLKQSITVGNLDLFKSKTVLNIPLGDRVASKISILESERDGVVENLGIGPDFGEEDRSAKRFDLRAELTDNITLDYGADDSDIFDSSRLEQAGFGGQPNRLDEVLPLRPIEDSEVLVNGQNLTLTFDLSDDLTIKSITGYRKVRSDFFHDGLPEVAPGFSISDRNTSFKQFSHEIQFLGNFLDDSLNVVAGIYDYKDEARQSAESTSFLGPRSPLDITESENDSLAFFSQTTFTPDIIDQRLHFTFGLRYAEDDREASRINENSLSFVLLGGITNDNCNDIYFRNADGMGLDLLGAACTAFPAATVLGPEGVVATAQYDRSFHNFNPSFTVAFDINDDMNVYAKVVEGYKSGGTSQRSANADLFALGFEEEDVLSYEVGYKGSLFDSRVQLNAAIFRTEIDGFQTSVQTGATPGDRDFVPIDGVEITGAEVDLTALIIEGLQFTFSYGYLDEDLGTAGLPFVDAFNVAQIVSLAPVPYAPQNSATAALDYVLPLNAFTLDFHVGFSYQDSTGSSINLADNVDTVSRGLWDANISLSELEAADGTLKFSLWGKNLGDKEYDTITSGAFAFAGVSNQPTFGDPRTYGLTATFEYR